MSGDRPSESLRVTSSAEEKELFFARFYARFPTETDCMEVICRAASPNGIKCKCGSLVMHRKYGERTARCHSCKKKVSATADTFFHGAKKATAHCCAIFLTGEGLAISANDFSRRVQVATSSGSVILHEVSAAIVNVMNDEMEMLSANLCDPVGKRSKETPAREHPKAEQADAEKRAAQRSKPASSASAQELLQRMSESTQTTNAIPENEIEKQIYELISVQPIQFDALCKQFKLPQSELLGALTMLELSGFLKALPGNRFEIIRKDVLSSIPQPNFPISTNNKQAKIFFQFVYKTFHRVSRKYLQRYLARYWCFIDRARWQFESLLELCARSGRKSHEELTSYVTPLSVKVVF
jgi:hypothetical protein